MKTWESPMRGLCKLCDTVAGKLAETLLLQGHSLFCVRWHLSRIGFPLTLERFIDHMEAHRTFSLSAYAWHHEAARWSYVPPSVPRVALGQQPELLLIRGLPYTGKTAQARLSLNTHVHIEADQYFFSADGFWHWDRNRAHHAHMWAEAWTHEALSLGQNVVVANTFLLNQWLEPYYAIAEELGAAVRIVEMPDSLIPSTPLRMNPADITYMRSLWEPLALDGEAWTFPHAVETLQQESSDVPLTSLSYFCQPFLCRQSLGLRWASAMIHTEQITRWVQIEGARALERDRDMYGSTLRAPLDRATPFPAKLHNDLARVEAKLDMLLRAETLGTFPVSARKPLSEWGVIVPDYSDAIAE